MKWQNKFSNKFIKIKIPKNLKRANEKAEMTKGKLENGKKWKCKRDRKIKMQNL